MEAHDNPAARLHALLEAVASHPDEKRFRDVWAEVLEVERDEVKLRLGQVGQLLADTEQSVRDIGDPAFEKLVRTNLAAWEVAIYPDNSGYAQTLGKVGFDESSLNALDVVASHLRTVRPEGRMPAGDRSEQLRADLGALIDDVLEANLPAQVERLVVDRLLDILRALADVRVGGTQRVRHAVEVLASELDLEEDTKRFLSASLRQKIKKTVVTVWVACAIPAQALAYWDGLEKLAEIPLHQILPPDELPPGKEQPQLPPGEGDSDDGDAEPDEDPPTHA